MATETRCDGSLRMEGRNERCEVRAPAGTTGWAKVHVRLPSMNRALDLCAKCFRVMADSTQFGEVEKPNPVARGERDPDARGSF